VLGYFGALNRSKGGMALLQVLDGLVEEGVDAHLLMIGDVLGASDSTNAGFIEEVRQQINRLGLQKRIQWTGREASEAVSADLNAVDICLLPYADGASLRRGTLMAALANGCAIVTTAPQTPIANLRDGVEALFVPLEGESKVAMSAVGAIKRLLAEPALVHTLRTNARAASSAFSWEEIARRHLKIYESQR
jgi:glycosyltransferase involved in cell wall biosynthesis